MIIRSMEEKDICAVSELEKSAFTHPWSEHQIREACQRDFYRFFTAWEGDILAGYCGMYYALDEADIVNIAVKETFRRQGIGKKLLKHMIEAAKTEGITCLFLEVRVSNLPAIGLYESLGFLPVGKRRDYYEFPREDALLYALKLENE